MERRLHPYAAPPTVAWLERRQLDIVCFQETKVPDERFPTAEIAALGYRTLVCGSGRWPAALEGREITSPFLTVEFGYRRATMVTKSVLAVVVILALTSAAMAAGSTSPSRPSPPPQPTNYDLGLKALRAGDVTRALTLFQQVVDAEPRNADAWNYLGYGHRQLKQFDESLAAYQKALAINPNHRGANEYLGELYLQTGNLAKAQERLDALKRLCPRGCKEYDDLNKAIKTYESARKSG